jgi:hypothetical protein
MAELLPLALLLACGPALLSAQDRPKLVLRPLVGQAIDGQGKPVADATVVVSWRPRGLIQLAEAVHVTARSNARGYFVAKVPPDLPLLAWAHTSPDADGIYTFCEAVECSAATQRLQLVIDCALTVERISIRGLEAWQDIGPLTLHHYPIDRSSYSEPVALPDNPAEEAVIIPPCSQAAPQLELRTPRGHVFLAFRDQLDLPAPVEVPVVTKDEAGNPRAGVTIWHRTNDSSAYGRAWGEGGHREDWRPVATTDAEGKATALLPLKSSPLESAQSQHWLVLRASAPGYADTHSGWQGKEMFIDGQKQAEEQSKDLQHLPFVMREESPLRARITLPPGARSESVLLKWVSKVAYNGGWTWLRREAVLPVTDDGRLEMASLPLDAYQFRVLAGHTELREGSEILRVAAGMQWPAGDLRELPEDATPPLSTWTIQVRDEDGAPPAEGRLLAIADMQDPDPRNAIAAAVPDALGRARMLLPRSPCFICWIGRSGYAVQTLPLAAESEPKETAKNIDVRLQLIPWQAMRLRLVDASGQPREGSRIQQSGSSRRGMREPIDRLLGELSGFAIRYFSDMEADADGTAAIRFIDLPGRTYRFQARSSDRKLVASFQLEPSEDPCEVVLR